MKLLSIFSESFQKLSSLSRVTQPGTLSQTPVPGSQLERAGWLLSGPAGSDKEERV